MSPEVQESGKQARKHEDDSMSIDWTLNIRRKCCRFFGDQKPSPSSSSYRNQVSLSKLKKQTFSDLTKATRQANDRTRLVAEDDDDQEHFKNRSSYKIDCKEADNLSALSASSSLLSQLLNSSLNQLIEIDNGSDSEPVILGGRRQVDERDLRLVCVASSSSSTTTTATRSGSATLTDGTSSSNISIRRQQPFCRPQASQKVAEQQTFVTFEEREAAKTRARRKRRKSRWRLRDFVSSPTRNQEMSFEDDLNERFKNLRLNSKSPPDGNSTKQQRQTTPRCNKQQVFAVMPSALASSSSNEAAAVANTQNDSFLAGATLRQMECGAGESDVTGVATTPQLINANSQAKSQQVDQQQQQQQQHDSLLEASSMGEEALEADQGEQEVACDFQCCPVCEFQFAQLICSAQAVASCSPQVVANNSRDQLAANLVACAELEQENHRAIEGQRQIIRLEDQQRLPSQTLRGSASVSASSRLFQATSSKASISSSGGDSSSSSSSSSSNSSNCSRGSSSCAIRVTTSSDSSEDSSDRLLKLKQHLTWAATAATVISTGCSESGEMGLASSNQTNQQQPAEEERRNFLLKNHPDRSQQQHHHHHHHDQRHCHSCDADLTATSRLELKTNQSGKTPTTASSNLDWILDESPFIIKGQSNVSATTQLLSVTKISPSNRNASSNNQNDYDDDCGNPDDHHEGQQQQRNSIQFSLDPRDLSVKKDTTREEDKSSMVEAKASLARVVDIDDSSCFSSSNRSGTRLQLRPNPSSSYATMMRDLKSAAPPEEPIYDIPSASPNIRQTMRCLSPEEKYPVAQRQTKGKVELSDDLVMIEKRKHNRRHLLAEAIEGEHNKRDRRLLAKWDSNKCNCDKCVHFRALRLYLSTRLESRKQVSTTRQQATNSGADASSLLSRLAEHGSGATSKVPNCRRHRRRRRRRTTATCLSSSCSCSTCSSSSTLVYLAEKRAQSGRRRSCSCCCSNSSCCSSSTNPTTTTGSSSSSSSDCSSTEGSQETAGSLTQEYLRRHRLVSGRRRGRHSGRGQYRKSTKHNNKKVLVIGSAGQQRAAVTQARGEGRSHVGHRLRSARGEGAQTILARNGLALEGKEDDEDEHHQLLMAEEHAMQEQQQQQQKLAANGREESMLKQNHRRPNQRVGGSNYLELEEDINGQINDLRLSRLAAADDGQSARASLPAESRRRSRLLLMQNYERLSEERSAELEEDDDNDNDDADVDDLGGQSQQVGVEKVGGNLPPSAEQAATSAGETPSAAATKAVPRKQSNYDNQKQGYFRQQQEELTPESSCSCCHASRHRSSRVRRAGSSILSGSRLVRHVHMVGSRSKKVASRITHNHHRHHYHHHQHHNRHHHHNRRQRHHHNRHHQRHHEHERRRYKSATKRQSAATSSGWRHSKSRHLCHLDRCCSLAERAGKAAANSHGRNDLVVGQAAMVEARSLEAADKQRRQKAKLIRRLLRRQQELDALETEFKQLELVGSSAAKLKPAARPSASDRMLLAAAASSQQRQQRVSGEGGGGGRLRVGAAGSKRQLNRRRRRRASFSSASLRSRRFCQAGYRRHFHHASNLLERQRRLQSLRRRARRQEARAIQTEEQQLENGSLFMKKFLVREIHGRGNQDEQQQHQHDNNNIKRGTKRIGASKWAANEDDGDLFSGWQLTKRCQCSHCCLVEKFILMDAQRKRQRKLARKLLWRQQCEAAIASRQQADILQPAN